MKVFGMLNKRKYYLIIAVFLALFVSSCAGGGGAAQSWPGVRADVGRGLAYLAHGQHVYAIDLVNGSEKWRFPDEGDNKISFFSPPALTSDGQLIVGGYDNILYSLNPENGQQNWKFDGALDKYIAGPLANGDKIYAPNSDSNLYALDLDGELLWSFNTEFEQWGTPLIDGDMLYLPSMDHSIYALDAGNGELLWKSEDLGGALAGTPALSADGKLYAGTLVSELLVVDANQKGKVSGSLPAEGWIWAGPALVEDVLYYGDMTGNFYAANAAAITPKWGPYKLGDSSDGFLDMLSQEKLGIAGTPLVAGDTVYFGSENGLFTALNADSGAKRWDKQFDGKLFQGPVEAGETILVAQLGKDELLFALGYDGSQKWSFIPRK